MFGFNFYTDRDAGFSIDDALDMFKSDTKMSKKEKFLHKMLTSKDFYGYVFINSDGARKEKLKELYTILTRYDNLRAVSATFEDYPIDDFPRTAAAFIFTVCEYVTNECNRVAARIDSDYRDGNIRWMNLRRNLHMHRRSTTIISIRSLRHMLRRYPARPVYPEKYVWMLSRLFLRSPILISQLSRLSECDN